MKLRLITFYTFSFILIFGIISTLNFFFKNSTLYTDTYTYSFSGDQYFQFKQTSLKNIFDTYFLEVKKIPKKKLKKTYKIENVKLSYDSPTYENIKTSLTFDIISKINLDKVKFLEEINNIYLGRMKKITKDLNDNENLYNYELIKKKYFKTIEDKNINAYYRLISSDFFAKYPPNHKCDFDNLSICYEIYSKFYLSMKYSLQENIITTSILNKLQITNETFKEEKIIDILNDFKLNNHLFDNYNLLTYKKYSEEFDYFSKKYDDLIKSDFFQQYQPKSFCQNYSKICFENLNFQLGKILSSHKLEAQQPFYINNYDEPTNMKFAFKNDTPLIIGLSIVFTYIFFIFTNNFFVRKLK